MQKATSIFFLLFIFYFCSSAQSTNFLKGKVIDDITRSPIGNCSVFINSTSRGTVTNDKGEFILQDLPEGNHELVISSIGYQTFVYDYNSTDLPLDVRVSLKQKATELSEVTVEPEVKDGWKVWGKTFLDNFIGRTENAEDCSIKNIKALHFRFSKKANKLTVIADEPLIIENKALGYSIKYQLEEFYVDFHSGISLYLGFPLFTEMNTDRRKKQLQWKEKREQAYLGSIIHFMKSLYKDQLKQQGFQLLRKVKTVNAEKMRVKDLYKMASQTTDTFEVQKDGTQKRIERNNIIKKDSIPYYESVLLKPDFYRKYLSIPSDSVINKNDDGTMSLFFTDSIYVVYADPKDRITRQSMIFLSTPAPVKIFSNGIYSPPQEIVTNDYWGRTEKVSNDLPLDYIEK